MEIWTPQQDGPIKKETIAAFPLGPEWDLKTFLENLGQERGKESIFFVVFTPDEEKLVAEMISAAMKPFNSNVDSRSVVKFLNQVIKRDDTVLHQFFAEYVPANGDLSSEDLPPLGFWFNHHMK